MLLSIKHGATSMEARNPPQSKQVENETFWRQHYESQKSSGLSRTAYCRQYDLNYDRFGYWISKWNHSHSDKLVSVKLKAVTTATLETTLCTLNLKNGYSLRIHDAQALVVILERYS